MFDSGGYLVIKRPWPSIGTIWGDNDRAAFELYWEKFQNRYVASDWRATRTAITGSWAASMTY